MLIRSDSNEYTQYTIFNINKIITLNCPKSAAVKFFSKGLKNKFETVVVNKPSVFEPLKFYCSYPSLKGTHLYHKIGTRSSLKDC